MISLRGMHPELRPYAEYAHRLAEYYGIDPQVTSVVRSWEDQDRLYKNYLAGKSRYPANRPGDSSHQYGFSWDAWVPAAEMPLWIEIRRHVGWEVFERDDIHGQLPNWRAFIE